MRMIAVSADTPPPVPTLYENGDISSPWPCTIPINWRSAWGTFVYILMDADDVVAYVGQTGNLVNRIKNHGRTKTFVRWHARKVSHGERLEFEAALIEKHRPYLYSDGTRRSW